MPHCAAVPDQIDTDYHRFRLPYKRKLDEYAPVDSTQSCKIKRMPGVDEDSFRGDIVSSSFSPSSSSSIFSSSSSTTLHFFVRTSSKTLVLHARPDETVENLIARVGAITGLPSRELRIIYGGRQLLEGQTLAECAIENDVTLQLLGRLRSTKFPQSWWVISDMLSEIHCCISLQPNPFCRKRKDGVAYSIDALVEKFIAITPRKEEDTVDHLQVFIMAGAHIALVKLYMSPSDLNREIAEKAIRKFLSSDCPSFLKSIQRQYSPIVLEFCKLLACTVGRKDRLYLACRSTLGYLLQSQDRTFFLDSKSKNLIPQLFPFVAELAEAVIAGLSSDTMDVGSTSISDFSNFLKALRLAIQDWLGGQKSIPKLMFKEPNILCEEWISSLYEIFIKLLNEVDKNLDTIDKLIVQNPTSQVQSLWNRWSKTLTILRECHKFAKIYEDTTELLHCVLFARKVPLNALIKLARRNEEYCWLLKLKDLTDYEAKRKLIMMLFPDRSDNFEVMHEMLIDRSQVLAESFEYIGQVDAEELHGGLYLEFKNEEATGPGVLREWFCLLCRAITSAQNVLFLPCPNDRRRFFPNPASVVEPLHLKYFNFVGRFIALCLMHKVQVGITFDRVFFLQLAGKTITLEDIQDADPCLYMSCKKILEMDDEVLDSDALGLTFVREFEEMGGRKSIELLPGGMEISVNSSNRKEYVRLLIKSSFVASIAEQIHHFSLGFGDMFSNRKHLKLFFQSLDLEDFNRMIGGSDKLINVKEWKGHTKYDGYNKNDCQISWFWKIVEDMEEEQKRNLLHFWTSVRYLPVEGFRSLGTKLSIYKASKSPKRLPTSQTCFYRLCLPQYSSFSIMREKLQFITQEHVSCTFGNW
ncbi:E3 ubiquitin-protein ligase UPL5 [Apostasia shenzhenica]|uniref:HECT-type E3 ubiquitin transferase n=1 Tax=Apostasia shenzhenica TaxID=1088818 RepID=A0A2I0A722_9ASPA|nr:E3 ubiquitin-protein ligase UPL5 [Apostasia shenzhenica]